MDFLELAKKRYSVRKFLDKDVEQEKIDYMLECAKVAPTAANRQPVYIKFIDGHTQLEKIKEVTKYTFNAPVWMLIVYDKQLSWKNKYTGEDKGDIDAAIVITHMMLAATQQGLGTCWVGSFDLKRAREIFELDDRYQAVALLPIGYPDETVDPNPLHYQRDDSKEHIL